MRHSSLKLAYLILSAAEQLSINLQAKDITIQEAVTGASLLTTHMHSLRNEQKFDSFYEDVVKCSSNHTEEPCLRRYRKVPRRFDQGESPHIYSCPKDRLHILKPWNWLLEKRKGGLIRPLRNRNASTKCCQWAIASDGVILYLLV